MPVAAHRREPGAVGESERDPARRGVHAEADVGGEVDGDQLQARIPARRIAEVSAVRDAVDARASEEVDAVDRALTAIQRYAVLSADLGGVVTVANLDDGVVEEVRRRPTVDVHAEHAPRQKVAVVADVVLLEDCLLYTSPSPRDRTRSRMPSSA